MKAFLLWHHNHFQAWKIIEKMSVSSRKGVEIFTEKAYNKRWKNETGKMEKFEKTQHFNGFKSYIKRQNV